MKMTTMSDNMTLFLEKVSADSELRKRIGSMTKEDIIAEAAKYGIPLRWARPTLPAALR